MSSSFSNRPEGNAIFRLRAWLPGLLSCWLLLPTVSGCQSKAPTAQVEKARHNLQLNRPRQAVANLVKEDSAEGHYLKAVALQSLGEKAAARDQITEALSIDSEEPKYRGYEALLDLNAGKKEAVQTLLDLYTARPSAPGVAFFATRAYVAKGDVKGALSSFKLGLTLIDEAPEFMFHALQHAVATEQIEIARQLLSKLELAAPEDAEFLRELLNIAVKAKLTETAQALLQRIKTATPDASDLAELQIKVELLLNQPEIALKSARQAVQSAPNDITLQLLLAEALVRIEPSPDHERELAGLAGKHPENPNFLRRHALYLVKAKRLPEAVTLFNQALAKTKSPAIRATLLNMSVRVPLEEGDGNLAEQQLRLHHAAFTNPLVVQYLTGRILYLKRDYVGAVERFQKVITSPVADESEAGRVLRAEAAAWQQQIVTTQRNKERLQKAKDELKKITQPKKAKPATEKAT